MFSAQDEREFKILAIGRIFILYGDLSKTTFLEIAGNKGQTNRFLDKESKEELGTWTRLVVAIKQLVSKTPCNVDLNYVKSFFVHLGKEKEQNLPTNRCVFVCFKPPKPR